jgi:hypothetical protein
MSSFKLESSGSFKSMETFLKKMSSGEIYKSLDGHARKGVAVLSQATPLDTGETKNSWDYNIKLGKKSCVITWTNSHTEDGVPIAIILQYGHGTGNGGYVQGKDYINPAMRPIFDEIADNVWKAVTSA